MNKNIACYSIQMIVSTLLLASTSTAQYLGRAVSYQYHSHGGNGGFSYSFAHPFPQHQETDDHHSANLHHESTPDPSPEIEHNPHHAALSGLKKFFLVNGINSIPYYESAPIQNTQVESTTWYPGSQQLAPPVEKLAPTENTNVQQHANIDSLSGSYNQDQLSSSLSQHSIPVSEQQQDTGWYTTTAQPYAAQSEESPVVTTTQQYQDPPDPDRVVVGYDGTRRYVPVYEPSSLVWHRPQYVPEPANQLLPPLQSPKPHRSKTGKGRHRSHGKRRKPHKGRKSKHRGSPSATPEHGALQGRELEDDDYDDAEDYSAGSEETR